MSTLLDFEVWRERQQEMMREADERRLGREARRVRSSRMAGIVLSVEKLIRWPVGGANVRSAMSVTPKKTRGSLQQHGNC